MPSPEICPNCGAEVPPGAPCCPECGSDENTGWSDKAHTDRLGIPDDDFDYDEFVREEFGSAEKLKPRGITWLWWVVALLLALAFLAWYF